MQEDLSKITMNRTVDEIFVLDDDGITKITLRQAIINVIQKEMDTSSQHENLLQDALDRIFQPNRPMA